jgi:phosphoribosyl-AMP cyclohydrolase
MNLQKRVVRVLFLTLFFSLSTSSVYASITVTSPNGGEYWAGTKTITWTSSGTSGFVNIYRCLTTDCSSTSTIAVNVTDTGSSTFDTSGLNATNKIYIEDASDTYK